MKRRCGPFVAAALASALLVSLVVHAESPIRYRFTITEPQHHWMQVEALFSGLTSAPLELRMSRSSPGRYSLHEFAKNVYDVHVLGPDGVQLTTTRPDDSGWVVPTHGTSVKVTYKIYGDRVDGTYLAIDPTHLHMNTPAAIMWARGLEDRPATLTFEPPPDGARWQVATQLHAGATPLEFSAPNFQYLMDSPVEFGPVTIRQFTSGPRTFRLSLHDNSGGVAERYVADLQKIVAEEGAVYGEFPEYEPGYYTFLADDLPWAHGDGMEHRNSTVMTFSSSGPAAAAELRDIAAHEFFHCWNVERIRPAGIEPFDFDRANITDSLWLAEGFTQYYGPVMLQRAGLVDLSETLGTMAALVNAISIEPGRQVRSAVEMSRMAPFVDGETPVDRTNFADTVISYYPYGGALALALDLSLRGRSEGRLSLDDFMRAMWRNYGKPGGTREGYVDHPYTVADAERTLAQVVGDEAFARDFFSRFVNGHEVPDYAALLARVGLGVRRRSPGRAWWGDIGLESRSGATIVRSLVPLGTPAYRAGLEQDDELGEVAGQKISSADDVRAAIARHQPGETIQIVFAERSGAVRTASVTLAEDPHLEIVPVENGGGVVSAQQQALRAGWLGPHR